MFYYPVMNKAVAWEKKRKVLLAQGKHSQLLRTYRQQQDFLPDENTGEFWDDIFAKEPGVFPMEQWRIETIAKLIDPHKSLLNLGVGRGDLETVLLKKYGQLSYLGTDIAAKTVDHLIAKFPDLHFQKTDLLGLSPKKYQFDQILLLEVLEHIKQRETFPVLKHIYKLTKPGGKFIVSVPVNEGLEEMLPINPNSHMRLYSESLLSFEVETVGFEVEKVYRASAFKNRFPVKQLINTFFHFKEPNNLILVCRKPVR